MPQQPLPKSVKSTIKDSMNHDAVMQSNKCEESARINWGEGQNMKRLAKAANGWFGKKGRHHDENGEAGSLF